MQELYDPAAIERAAQDYWDERRAFAARENPARPKFYCLSMFPYPSGRLHMGHVRNYTIGDVLARFMRMQGHNVLQPMGWDAFGLPAENAAMQQRRAAGPMDPRQHRVHEARSCSRSASPSTGGARSPPAIRRYYRWNQWLFLRMLRAAASPTGKTGVVNWDPVDQTVLANEQVIDGRGWRTGRSSRSARSRCTT